MADATDLTDLLKVTDETPESIKGRLLADTNAGVDPNDPSYADTAPGSFWDDIEGAGCLEWDRVYDRMNEVVAAAIPATSFGAFLDDWADSLNLLRRDAAFAGGVVTFTGTDGVDVPLGTQVSTAATSADADPVTFQTTEAGTIAGGSVDLQVIAVEAGSAGNVPGSTITIMDSGVDASVSNADPMTGGDDVENDDRLRVRILRKLSGAGGGGNQDDYVNWGLNYPGVGFVTVQPNTPTVGHVTVVITDINNDPMPTFAVDGLQEVLDPSALPAQGAGLAPVGATVHVATPTSAAVVVVTDVVLEDGFTLDGSGGTRATGEDIAESLRRYINRLPVGGDVIRMKVIAAIVDVVGVADVTTLTLNGGSTNVAIGATEVALMTEPPTVA